MLNSTIGELDRLVRAQFLPERLSPPGILDALLNAIHRRAQATRRLPQPILVHERLRYGQSVADLTQDRRRGHEYIGEGQRGVVGGHVERPLVTLDVEPGSVARDKETL